MITRGEVNKRKNYREAKSRVEYGAPSAKHFDSLAWHYHSGSGVEKDDIEAYYYFRRAAEMGLASAQSMLGSIYSIGIGIPANEIKAVYWFIKASKQNNMTATVNLGRAYKTGSGIKQNDIKAVECFKKAAREHEAFSDLRETALYSLGQMYRSGLGVTESCENAYILWSEAASFNYSPAIDGVENLKKEMTEKQIKNAQKTSFVTLLKD